PRIQDQSLQMPDVVSMGDKVLSQRFEKLLVGRGISLRKTVYRLDNARPEIVRPNSVHEAWREVRIVGLHHPADQRLSRICLLLNDRTPRRFRRQESTRIRTWKAPWALIADINLAKPWHRRLRLTGGLMAALVQQIDHRDRELG